MGWGVPEERVPGREVGIRSETGENIAYPRVDMPDVPTRR